MIHRKKINEVIEKELTSVKFASFGKVKLSSKSKNQKKLEDLQRKKNEIIDAKNGPVENSAVEDIDNKISSTLKQIEVDKLEKDINELENISKTKGRAAAVFALRDKILGKKKTQPEQVLVKDPVTGKDVYEPAEIKRVTSQYLIDLLTTKQPEGKYVEIVQNKEKLHHERMKEKIKMT